MQVCIASYNHNEVYMVVEYWSLSYPRSGAIKIKCLLYMVLFTTVGVAEWVCPLQSALVIENGSPYIKRTHNVMGLVYIKKTCTSIG